VIGAVAALDDAPAWAAESTGGARAFLGAG
jgi:hypothetical protein